MATAFIGEIRCFAFNFAPYGWATCNGQILQISQNDALYSLLGTTFGGDGQNTFGLPNLQGQVPMHWGNGPGGFNTTIGQVQGSASVTLTTAQMPAHTHSLTVAIVPSGGVVERTPTPTAAAYISDSSPARLFATAGATLNAPFSGKALAQQGGSQPHENMQPYLAMTFCICLTGIYPSRN
jgi:microcystin-dependent protein